MNYTVYLRPDAEIDLIEAARWYEKQRQGLGGDFVDEVQYKCNAMAENPYLYPVVHRNTHRALIRRFPFAIFYRIEENSLVIVAIMHGSRDPKRWKKRT